MEFLCDLCDVKVSSPVLLEGHLTGKKHLRNVEQKKALQQIADRSIFISKFQEPVESQVIEQTLHAFGEVDRIILDKQNPSYAIVEFKNPDVAQELINSMKKLQIGNNGVIVKPRKVDFVVKSQIHALSPVDIIDCLNTADQKDVSSQVDALISNFGMTSEMMAERAQFTKELKTFLQKFFASAVRVEVFGSSSTGLGFINSDLDITFSLLDESGAENESTDDALPSSSSSPTSESQDNSKSLLSCDVQVLLENSVTKKQFSRLSNHDKARVLNRMINLYRKQSGAISSLVPVPDARCPVVRFALRKPFVLCELSMQNAIGEIKANFIRHVVDADDSGDFRRFMFVVKLWAHTSGILSFDEAHPRSHCNSYTLCLLMVSFLQSCSLIPAIQISDPSKKVQGWCVDYMPLQLNLGSQDVSRLLKGFFNFLYNTLRETNIHCIKDGVVYVKEDFERKFFNSNEDERVASKFKFSLANIQDPLELSHNVASNVSKHYLSLLRQKLMFSLSVLKSNPNNLAGLFDLDAVRLQWSSLRKERDSGHVLSIDVGTMHAPSVVAKNFMSILKDVLLLEEIHEPSKKRSRRDFEGDDNDFLFDIGHSLQFVAQFPVWMGRRQLRRQLANTCPQLSALELERKVSLELRSKTAVTLGLKFGVQVYFEDDQMHCIFQVDKEQDAQDLLHFFATFLPRFLPSMQNVVDDKPLDKEIDDLKRENLVLMEGG